MSDERWFKDRQTTVTVGLTDGRTLVGFLGRFRPGDADLVLSVRCRDAMGLVATQHLSLAAEHIAYVAVHRGGTLPSAPAGGTVDLDIHVAGGLTFSVRAEAALAGDRLGFWALPLSASGAFGEIYFYAHGINAREEKATLAAILVETGALAPAGVARGLEGLAAERAANIGDILIKQKKVGVEDVAAAAATQRDSGAKGRRLRLGEILVEAGLAREEDIQAALSEQKQRRGKRIGEVLIEMGLVSEIEMAKALSKKFNLPFVDLDDLEIDPRAVALVQPDLVRKYQMLPLRSDEQSLTIALSDPLAFEAIDLLRFSLGRRIVEMVATPSQIASRIEAMVSSGEPAPSSDQMEEILSTIQLSHTSEGAPDARDLTVARDDDSGISKLVNQIIYEAHARGASDIHIEPDGEENDTTIRFRIDGTCEVYRKFQPALRARLVSRIKIMAQMDITERRKPQDGKIRILIKDTPLELRVATIPTVSRDEDVVLRILAGGEPLPMERLLLSRRNHAELKKLIGMPYGLILAVGPVLDLYELPDFSTETQHRYLIDVRGDAQSKILVAMVPLLGRLLLEASAGVREQKLKQMVEFMAGQIVVPTPDDTKMAQRLAARHSRVLEEFGFFTAEQLAELNHSRAANQGALANNWKKRRQAFAVPHQDETGQIREVFPKFQFEDGRPTKTVQRVLAELGDRKSPWKIALWFTSDNGWLPGQARPVDLLEADPEGIVQAARFEAAGGSV